MAGVPQPPSPLRDVPEPPWQVRNVGHLRPSWRLKLSYESLNSIASWVRTLTVVGHLRPSWRLKLSYESLNSIASWVRTLTVVGHLRPSWRLTPTFRVTLSPPSLDGPLLMPTLASSRGTRLSHAPEPRAQLRDSALRASCSALITHRAGAEFQNQSLEPKPRTKAFSLPPALLFVPCFPPPLFFPSHTLACATGSPSRLGDRPAERS